MQEQDLSRRKRADIGAWGGFGFARRSDEVVPFNTAVAQAREAALALESQNTNNSTTKRDSNIPTAKQALRSPLM